MKRLQLIWKSPISEFANAVYTYRDTIYRLWLISPWMGMHTDGSVDPLQLMIDAVRTRQGCIVTVITRQPLPKAQYHQDAVRILKANVKPTVFYCNSLHTKLYILEAGGAVAAMLGSPNLTAGGNSANIELAIQLRTTSLRRGDEISTTVDDLLQYAHGLLSDEAVTLAP